MTNAARKAHSLALALGLSKVRAMNRLKSFWHYYSHSRHYGFRFCWSVRTAWKWSKGPTAEMREARRQYGRAVWNVDTSQG